MSKLRHDRRVHAELSHLQAELQNLVLPLNLPGVNTSRDLIQAVSHQLRDYLIPRFEQWDAPIIVVVGGSTGAGKSTLVNALVGEEVSPASAIRPTTRVPVLLHHPSDREWFHTSTLLPRWVRDASVSEPAESAADDPLIRLRSSSAVPPGLALIDAPDIDSLDPHNRLRARELLDAADAWIFATTAMRYADAVPWEYLKEARERNAVIMLVLGRAPHAHAAEVTEDLSALLRTHGLHDAPVFTIIEKSSQGEATISAEELRPIAGWLEHLITPDARDLLVKQTAVGATQHLLAKVEQIAVALEEQHTTREALESLVLEHFHTGQVEEALKDGELLRGEVLDQWHEFLGTGEYLRRLEAGVGRVRDRVTRLWRKPAERNLKEELSQGFAGLIVSTASQAAQRAYSAMVGVRRRELASLPSG